MEGEFNRIRKIRNFPADKSAEYHLCKRYHKIFHVQIVYGKDFEHLLPQVVGPYRQGNDRAGSQL